MRLDFQTIFVVNSALLAALSLFPVFVSFTALRQHVYLRHWAFAFPVLLVGTVTIALRGILPELVSILVGNLFVSLAYLLLFAGVLLYSGRRPSWRPALALLVLMELVLLVFTRFLPSLAFRVVFMALLGSAICGAAAISLLGRNRARPREELLSGVFLFVLASLGLIRSLLVVVAGYGKDFLEPPAWEAVLLILESAGFVGLALSLLLLHSARLRKGLEEAGRQRDLLFKEMNHRIKNDLTLVDSLISIEQRALAKEGLACDFESLRDRVRSIAYAHDLLSRDSDPGKVMLDQYLSKVLSGIPCPSTVAVETDLAEVEAGMDVAVPLGLVMTELVINSIRHGFPEGRRGRLSLGLRPLAEGRARLEVADDGVGSTWPPTRAGLGTMIVDSFVKKLGGRLEVEGGAGTRFSLEFNTASKAARPARREKAPAG